MRQIFFQHVWQTLSLYKSFVLKTMRIVFRITMNSNKIPTCNSCYIATCNLTNLSKNFYRSLLNNSLPNKFVLAFYYSYFYPSWNKVILDVGLLCFKLCATRFNNFSLSRMHITFMAISSEHVFTVSSGHFVFWANNETRTSDLWKIGLSGVHPSAEGRSTIR